MFTAFLRLGLTSFGGPVAHLGYFRAEFVDRRRWLTETAFADLVALCQLLPGPASSQVGVGIGLTRAGLPGAFAAWAGFTLPSAVAMVLFAQGVTHIDAFKRSGCLHGLKIVAVAIVAQALLAMRRTLCPDRKRVAMMIAAAVIAVTVDAPLTQLLIIAASALCGTIFFRAPPAASLSTEREHTNASLTVHCSRPVGALLLALYGALLFGLPVAAAIAGPIIGQFERFYRAGALVFGGGHVVLPLLQAQLVPIGLVSNDLFLAGYGAAQAVPGPLFSFAAYLGAINQVPPQGWPGAGICLVALFLPGLLLIVGVLPFWDKLRSVTPVQSAMQAVNAAVVGILLAAFYDPIWTSAIHRPGDFIAAGAAWLLLAKARMPPWLVVALAAMTGAALW